MERRETDQPAEVSGGALFAPASNSSTNTEPVNGNAAEAFGQPFGPGSALPRPGGGRPAPEFTVKASVTALRYCTEDSPQFPRMVAEVWFRNAQEAQQHGFRPLSDSGK